MIKCVLTFKFHIPGQNDSDRNGEGTVRRQKRVNIILDSSVTKILSTYTVMQHDFIKPSLVIDYSLAPCCFPIRYSMNNAAI